MNTKGYNSYRGRANAAKIALIVVLVLVILGALGYLVMQNYVVYDDNGTARLELPFFKEKAGESTLGGNDVQIDVVTPTDTAHGQQTAEDVANVPSLQAGFVPAWLLKQAPRDILANMKDAMVIDVKTDNGAITYTTGVDVPAEVYVEQGDTMETLQTLLQSEHYAVARMSVFCDSYFVRAHRDAALCLESGGLWYDANGAAWLDPSNPQTLVYITSLCQEYAQLGFEEIMLDNFCYPTNGRVSTISGTEGVDRTQVLTDFVHSLRVNLPEDVALSIAVRGELGAESGLTAQLLDDEFLRIYTASADAADALAAQMPEGFDASAHLVPMVYRAPASGNYLLMQ